MKFDWTRLARMPLYQTVWGGRAPAALEDATPMSMWQWRRHVHADAGRSLLSHPALWVLHTVPGDDPIWVPFGPPDIVNGAAFARGMFTAAGILPGDMVLAVAPPAPWAGNTLPYLFSATDRLLPSDSPALAQGLRPDTPPTGAEVFPLSVTTVAYKADLSAFPLSRLLSVVAGSPGEIDALLQHAQRAGVAPPRFRLALLVGPDAAEPRSIELAHTVVPLLYLPGLFAPLGGRPEAAGVWLPSEMLTAEIVLDDEWGRSVRDPSCIPQMRAVGAAVGESGELVITVDNAALPVIRLRTAIRIRVEENTPAGARVTVLTLPTVRPVAESSSAFTPAARR